jgi:hypothetical protein
MLSWAQNARRQKTLRRLCMRPRGAMFIGSGKIEMCRGREHMILHPFTPEELSELDACFKQAPRQWPLGDAMSAIDPTKVDEAWADIQRADRVKKRASRTERGPKASENTLGLCAWCVRDGINVLSRGAPLVTFEGRTVCAVCGHLSGPTPCPVRECAHALEPRWTLARGVVQGCPVHGPGTVEDE